MKLLIIAGPPSGGKTTVIRQIIKNLPEDARPAFIKIDVVHATEDEELATEFGIPVKKVYSGDLCPDHMGILILEDALNWAKSLERNMLIVESAGLCLRCTPYTTGSLGIAVVSSISGTNSPFKMAPLLSLADVAVVTKTDLVSQAEKEVFRESIRKVVPSIEIVETNAIQGTGLRYLMRRIEEQLALGSDPVILRGSPPLGVCTICIGKKEIGWQKHFGMIRPLDMPESMYRGD